MPISLIPTKKSKGPAAGLFDDVKLYAKEFLPALAVITAVFIIHLAVSFWFSGLKAEYDELESQKQALLEQLKGAGTEETKDLVSRARAIEGIIDSHILSSGIFEPFEEDAHPQIVINNFNLDIQNKELIVEGTAPNLEALGEQFIIWKDEALFISEAELGTFSKDEEGIVSFNANFEIKDDYLK